MVVVCCIGIGCCDCGSTYCKSWSEYYNDKDRCRTKGGVDKATMNLLSWIPLTGFSSFYSGKQLDGIFEAIHGFSTLILSCAGHVVMSSRHNDCTGCGFCMIWIIAIVDIAKMVEAAVTGVMKNWVELAIIITSFILSRCSFQRFEEDRINMPRAAFVLTASVTVLEWIKHIVSVRLDWELDVNGCKLL